MMLPANHANNREWFNVTQTILSALSKECPNDEAPVSRLSDPEFLVICASSLIRHSSFELCHLP